jgi:hypothetical protein
MTRKQTKSGKKSTVLKKELLKVDLGCGDLNKPPGWIGVDIVKTPSVDVVHDLTKFPWPFANESCSEMQALHLFEHIPKQFRFAFMDEVYRILVPDGTIKIQCPYWSSGRAYQDPTHEWPPINEGSFFYFWKKWRVDNKLDHYAVHCDFDFSWGYVYDPETASRTDEIRQFNVKNYNNSVMDLVMVLTKKVGR